MRRIAVCSGPTCKSRWGNCPLLEAIRAEAARVGAELEVTQTACQHVRCEHGPNIRVDGAWRRDSILQPQTSRHWWPKVRQPRRDNCMNRPADPTGRRLLPIVVL